MHAVRSGRISTDKIREMWSLLGDAFGLDTMQGHGIRKLYGYAGDFEMIDRIYQYSLSPKPSGRRWDEYFQSRKACEAVRNRKKYFHNLLESELEQAAGHLQVLNVGSGPARDISELGVSGAGLIVWKTRHIESQQVAGEPCQWLVSASCDLWQTVGDPPGSACPLNPRTHHRMTSTSERFPCFY